MAIIPAYHPKLAQFVREGEGKGRRYVNPADGKRYPSVTTILKRVDKSSLVGWATGIVADYAIDNYDKLGTQDPETTRKYLRYVHNDLRDERAWVGSGVHNAIQAEHEGHWFFPELDEEQIEIMDRWHELNESWEIEPILTEYTVLNETVGYMGTADGLWRFTDRISGEMFVAAVDIKTSKSLWPEHEMQLAALTNAEFLYQEVEDPEGAHLHKWKDPETGKMVKTYWQISEPPKFDAVVMVHLRRDYAEIVPISGDRLDLRWKQFKHYVGINEIEEALKGVI